MRKKPIEELQFKIWDNLVKAHKNKDNGERAEGYFFGVLNAYCEVTGRVQVDVIAQLDRVAREAEKGEKRDALRAAIDSAFDAGMTLENILKLVAEVEGTSTVTPTTYSDGGRQYTVTPMFPND